MEVSLPQLILPIKLERSSERLTSRGGVLSRTSLCKRGSEFISAATVRPIRRR